MQITVQLPDDLAQHPNPGRDALESLAIEGYRDVYKRQPYNRC